MKHVDFYRDAFKAWPKQAGNKPSETLLATVHSLGLRPGKQALANAMYLRPEGATTGQVCMVVGAPQLNRMRGLIAGKLAKRAATEKTADGHTVYRIELTARGTERVNKAEAKAVADAEAGQADKAKAKAKAKRKAKAKPDNAPADVGGVDAERAQAPEANQPAM